MYACWICLSLTNKLDAMKVSIYLIVLTLLVGLGYFVKLQSHQTELAKRRNGETQTLCGDLCGLWNNYEGAVTEETVNHWLSNFRVGGISDLITVLGHRVEGGVSIIVLYEHNEKIMTAVSRFVELPDQTRAYVVDQTGVSVDLGKMDIVFMAIYCNGVWKVQVEEKKGMSLVGVVKTAGGWLSNRCASFSESQGWCSPALALQAEGEEAAPAASEAKQNKMKAEQDIHVSRPIRLKFLQALAEYSSIPSSPLSSHARLRP